MLIVKPRFASSMVFRVKIPFKIGTQDKNSNLSDKPVSLDDYSVEGMRALVVEDNELNMEIAEFMLLSLIHISEPTRH